MKREMRFAIRMLLKQPGFSLMAVLTPALGIGATAALFSLIQGVLLTPPPYKEPQQLVLVPTARMDAGSGLPFAAFAKRGPARRHARNPEDSARSCHSSASHLRRQHRPGLFRHHACGVSVEAILRSV